jgi:hypothetical protein
MTMTGLRTPTGESARPGFAAHASGWSRTRLTRIAPLDPRLDALALAIDATHVNSGARIAQFEIHADPDVADYFPHNRVEADFFRYFFSHPDVVETFSRMPLPERDSLGFQRLAAPEVLGTLVNLISAGGAYERFAGSDREARKLANHFAAAIGGRFSTAGAWVSTDAWNAWFRGVIWDHSFFWLDRATGIATVLLITDTD